ncbi:MAG TPA: hypothetical protein VGI92_13910 [Gemmatimonadales bacterium]|jgi:hypothetical protein
MGRPLASGGAPFASAAAGISTPVTDIEYYQTTPMTGLTLGDRIQLKLIGGGLDRVLLELDSFRDSKPGQRVRVLLKSGKAIEGVVNTASASHLSVISSPDDTLHQLAPDEIQRIQATGNANARIGPRAGLAIVGGFGLGAASYWLWSEPLIAIGVSAAVTAAITAGLREAGRRRQTWFTIWEASPELPPAV